MGYISPTLAVRDMRRTIQFYRDSLGFKRDMAFADAENSEYADLSKDRMVIMLIPTRNIGIGAEERLGIGVSLYLQIDGNIHEYYDEPKTKDIAAVMDTLGVPFGIRDFTVEDINGYKLTFNQVSEAVKPCVSCGMPTAKPEDFGGGSAGNLYCVRCSKPDGSLKSYEQAFEGMVKFMMLYQKLDRKAAESAAEVHMTVMPAWSGRA